MSPHPFRLSPNAAQVLAGSPAPSICNMAEARRTHVLTLRKLARSVDVTQAKDSASKDKVMAMITAIKGKRLSPKQRSVLGGAETAYLGTFQPQGCSDNASANSGGALLRGRSFMLTYNWDFMAANSPDETPKADTRELLWGVWCAWMPQLVQQLGVVRFTSKMEESLNSSLAGRVHFHLKVDLEKALDRVHVRVFAFHGIKPDAQSTVVAADPTPGIIRRKARGANQLEASNRGHFYVWVWKKGSLFRDTNWHPWQQYRVQGKWLDDLLTDQKLDSDTYEAYALRVGIGYADRKRNLDVVRAAHREAWVDTRMACVDAELAKIRAPFRTFEEVKRWEDSFLQLDFRWKLLALVADSAAGKSNYAESLFDNPLVLTVEDADALDLKSFECDRHDGIVLDNCNSWGQILKWRAVLQARNAKSRGGQSATNVFSYVQYLFGVAIVATFDWDTPDAYLVDDSHPKRSRWLLKNCVFVRLAAGDTFFVQGKVPQQRPDNTFSLFAATVKRRRQQVQAAPVS